MAYLVNDMIFKPMDPADVKKAIEGASDILTPAVAECDAYFAKLSCPSCGGECFKFVDAKRLFREGALLPSYLARCKACGVDFEPYTKIQVSGEDPNKVTF